jgi:uncharacterized 2Fe-2S/4Fe-4S cluster protein (DUF4445 family)
MATENARNSWIEAVTLAPPSLSDNTADQERLLNVLQKRLGSTAVRLDPDLVGGLPRGLRQWDYALRCAVVRDRDSWIVCGLTGMADPQPLCGLAIDLGTTRIVFSLVNLDTGVVLREDACDNPQGAIGPDVLTRIHYTDEEHGLDRLNRLVIDGINGMIRTMCRQASIHRDRVVLLTVAGNTAMTHLFMGLDPHWIIREPYIPVVNRPGVPSASRLGLDAAPGARVVVFPNIGSYFGGDLIAGILYSGLDQRDQTALLVDVGTNAEVVLGDRNWLIACAGAAGPALESGVSRIGTTARPGAIDRLRIVGDDRRFELRTIDNAPPVGICGSGVIDLAAQLFLSGMIDIQGRFVASLCGARLRTVNGEPRLVVAEASETAAGEDLTIGQVDLESLIRSKAAMYTILETLTEAVGMTPEQLDSFYVGGTFGAYIDPRSAIAIGMLPDLPLDHYHSLGNSSLEGAKTVLRQPESLARVDQIRNRITYMELNVNQAFMNRFSAAKFLPHTNPDLFPSVHVPGSGRQARP